MREVKATGASCTSRQSAGRPFLLCSFYLISVNILMDLFQMFWWICFKYFGGLLGNLQSGFVKYVNAALAMRASSARVSVNLISGDAHRMLGFRGF